MDFNQILEEMRKQERGKAPEMSVTVKTEDGETTYTEDFLVLHVGKDSGTVVGVMGIMELLRAVDMMMDSVGGVMKQLPPHMQMFVSHVLMDRMMERIKDEEGDE